MSQVNVELVRKAFEAFKSGGMESVLPFYAPDVVCYPISEWLEDPVYRGHDGALKLTAWTDNFDDVAFEAHEIRDVQERVVVLAELTGQIKDSGVPIRQAFGVVYSDFRDGTTGEVRYFLSWQQALEAVGQAG
jgi:ketosteroid isomerase-like protein